MNTINIITNNTLAIVKAVPSMPGNPSAPAAKAININKRIQRNIMTTPKKKIKNISSYCDFISSATSTGAHSGAPSSNQILLKSWRLLYVSLRPLKS